MRSMQNPFARDSSSDQLKGAASGANAEEFMVLRSKMNQIKGRYEKTIGSTRCKL